MSSLARIFLPALLAGAALTACDKQDTTAADDAYDHVNKICQASDSFSCVAAVNKSTAVFTNLLKVDAAKKQSIAQACAPSASARSGLYSWGGIELATQLMKAANCLDEISAAVPENDKNLKLNVELSKLTLISNIKGERRLRV